MIYEQGFIVVTKYSPLSKYVKTDHKFQWVDQSPVPFTYWATKQPSITRLSFSRWRGRIGIQHQQDKTCVSMNLWDGGKWSTIDCSVRLPVICSHKKWHTKDVIEQCVDRPPSNQRSMCKVIDCKTARNKQKRHCMKTCGMCSRSSWITKTNGDATDRCEGLISYIFYVLAHVCLMYDK